MNWIRKMTPIPPAKSSLTVSFRKSSRPLVPKRFFKVSIGDMFSIFSSIFFIEKVIALWTIKEPSTIATSTRKIGRRCSMTLPTHPHVAVPPPLNMSSA